MPEGRGMMVRRFLFGAALGLSGLLASSSSPARAQFVCTTTSTDSTCNNSGTAGNENNFATGAGQNATTTNSGTVGGTIQTVAGAGGNATTSNSGAVAGSVFTSEFTGNGNATTTNSGTVSGIILTQTNGAGNAATTNSGTVGAAIESDSGNGNAVTTNSGTVTGYVEATASGSGNATATNSGTTVFIDTLTEGGGNAVTINSGTVSGGIGNYAFGSGNAIVTNYGAVSGGVFLTALGGGSSTVTNYGVISGGGGGPAIQFFVGRDTLTNVIGSRVIGAIDLAGVKDTINFVGGGNWLFTFNTLAAATINSNGAPFVVAGNRVAVLDPTAFGMTDRTLMDFTGAVSSMLQSRFDDLAWPASVAPAGSNAFAGAPANTVAEQANAAFADIPALAYAGQTGASVVPNAVAVGRETATVAWSQGFAGARQQQAEGLMLASTNSLYGGAIGLDTPFGSNLRLGAFVGAGHGRLGVDLNTQTVDTDYVFGGGYGRFDWTWQFLDFAVSAGHTANASTRTIADNLSPTGLDTATASYGGWYVSPELAYGVRLPLGASMLLIPIGRLRYLGASLDGYSEAGSPENLNVPRRNVSDFEQRFELDLQGINETRFGVLKTTVKAGVLGLERLGDTTVNTVLIGQNLAFATPGPNLTGGGFIGLDLDYRLTKIFRVFTTGEATFTTDHGVIGTVEGGVRAAF
jgi:Autotransporter beta-domain